jgi:hypothetical protein
MSAGLTADKNVSSRLWNTGCKFQAMKPRSHASFDCLPKELFLTHPIKVAVAEVVREIYRSPKVFERDFPQSVGGRTFSKLPFQSD